MIAAALTRAGSSAAEPHLQGLETYDLANRAVDLTELALRQAQAQQQLQDLPWHISLTSRSSPVSFDLANSSSARGSLTRMQLLMGGGFGDTKGGVFFAMQGDQVQGVGGKAQMLMSLGGAFADVQAFAGLLLNEQNGKSFGLDGNGNFNTKDSWPRPGAPVGAQQPWFLQSSPNSLLLSAYDGNSGASVQAQLGDRYKLTVHELSDGQRTYEQEYASWGVQTLRLHLQPLRYYLPREVGLPFADIANYRRSMTDVAAGSSTTTRSTDFSLGADNVLDQGFRWRAVITNEGKPRILEAGYVQDFVFLVAAARAMAVRYGDSYGPSAEAFVQFKIPRVFGIGLSYSYNTPDMATFLPIHNAHVFGIQVCGGPTEMANPLVPLVRSVEDRKRRGKAE